MKLYKCYICDKIIPSLPVRGAWVEMIGLYSAFSVSASRSPCGERGLKYFWKKLTEAHIALSLPVRGAWVEIPKRVLLS